MRNLKKRMLVLIAVCGAPCVWASAQSECIDQENAFYATQAVRCADNRNPEQCAVLDDQRHAVQIAFCMTLPE